MAQIGADDLCDQFEVLGKHGLNDDQLDMCLLRGFVAEMFFEDSGNAAEALAPDNLNLDMVDPFLWIFAWAVVTGIWFFCLYWALVWGIVNGEDILIIWLVEFGTAIVQDIFFFIPFVLLIMNSSAIVKIEPQMRHVYSQLEEIATQRLLMPSEKRIGTSSEKSLLFGDEKNKDLNQEISRNTGFNAIQYTSSACRAARSEKGRMLPSARLLAVISDLDVFKIRKNPGSQIRYSFILLLVLPIAFIFQGLILDLFIEVVVPVTWTGFMIANMYALQKIFWVFIGLYTFIGIFLIYYFRKNLNDFMKLLRDCCSTEKDVYSLSDKFEVFVVKREAQGFGLGLAEHLETGL